MKKIISFISAFLLCTCCVSAEEYFSKDSPQDISSVSVTEEGFRQDDVLTDISEEQEAAASKPAAPTVSGSITGVFGGRKIRFISETEDAVIYFSDSTSALSVNDRHAENGEEILFERFYGTVYARAYKDGVWSDPSRYILKIPEAKTPEIDVSDNTAVITTSPGNYIVYTTDGTDPVINTCADIREAVANGNLVTRNTASVTVSSTTVIKAVAIRNTFTTSSTAQADVTVADVPAPVFTTNIVFGGKAVTITSDDPDAVIYYKLGSSDISTDSPSLPQGEALLFDEPFAGGIYSKAYKNGRWSKLSKTGLNNVKLAAPVIQKTSDGIRIYSAAKNSYICYTTDGTVPSVRSGINKVEVTNGKFAYSTDITVSAEPGQTVKAVVVRSGLVTSDTSTYTVPEDTSAGFDTKLTAFDITDRMTVGWNLGNSLDAIGSSGMSSETSWGNPKTTEKMIKDIKAAGFNTIRIPVSWGIHADDSGNISSEWMDRVQQVVDYAYNNDMYIILNSHHDNAYYDINGMVSSTAVCDRNIAKMKRVWTQISLRFKDYDHRLLFETLNEPRTEGSANEWRGGTASERNVLSKLNNGIVSA
ncbi:MAG: cellulase family glycosylhydrolase, partial [Oscillospiraceae bacterium]|nr:cellulase family glycosylhydrolase [Oscillospiraceae bacterium]